MPSTLPSPALKIHVQAARAPTRQYLWIVTAIAVLLLLCLSHFVLDATVGSPHAELEKNDALRNHEPAYTGVLHSTPLRKEEVNRIDEDGVTLVSSPSERSYVALSISSPISVRIFRFASSIHPRKDYGATHEDYQMTTLFFAEDEQSLRAPFVQAQSSLGIGNLTFTCTFDDQEIPAAVFVQSRNEFFTVECPLPSWREDLSLRAPRASRMKALKRIVNGEIGISIYHGLNSEELSLSSTQILKSWYSPPTQAEFGACIAPVHLSNHLQWSDLLEWRVHGFLQGMTIAHWYSRDGAFVHWVERLNAHLGVNDTVQYAPFFSARTQRQGKAYVDQAIWYQDCLLRYGFNTKWMAIIDLDEFLMQSGEMGQDGVLDYLRRQPENLASLSMYHVYWGGDRLADAPKLSGFPRFPRNGYSNWTYSHTPQGMERTMKAIHRTSAVRHLWVHDWTMLGDGWTFRLDHPEPGLGHLVLHHWKNEPNVGINLDEVYTPLAGDKYLWHKAAERLLQAEQAGLAIKVRTALILRLQTECSS